MKTLITGLFISLLLLSSCSTDLQVEYAHTGELGSVTNENEYPVSIGDTIIIEHYIAIDTSYGIHSTDAFWGRYTDSLPDEQFDSRANRTFRRWYEKAVVIKD